MMSFPKPPPIPSKKWVKELYSRLGENLEIPLNQKFSPEFLERRKQLNKMLSFNSSGHPSPELIKIFNCQNFTTTSLCLSKNRIYKYIDNLINFSNMCLDLNSQKVIGLDCEFDCNNLFHDKT